MAFGDRTPLGYKKFEQLGKGGSAIVWKADSFMHGKIVALKQFPKINGEMDKSIDVELDFQANLFAENNGSEYVLDKELTEKYPGITHITRLLDQIETEEDVWLVYEIGEQSLGSRLFHIDCETRMKGDQVFSIKHDIFYEIIVADKTILPTLVYKIAEILDCLQNAELVHSDLKPDNLLVELDEENTSIKSIKLIDFGSSFKFASDMQISGTTPEYLSPELLAFIMATNKNKGKKSVNSSKLKDMCK